MIRTESILLEAGKFQLREISLGIAPGEYFVLMGPTGAGKSLLLKCICGLIRPAGGSIYIDGQDVTKLEPRLRQIGYVPQEGALFPHLSVARNITFALCARGMRHRKALTQSSSCIDVLGIGPLLDRAPLTLSGGEKQKVALARAIVSQPLAILLDEPVSALDELSRQAACCELRRIQQHFGLTVMHVCHNLSEAESVADRVGILVDGQLAQAGPLDELRAAPINSIVKRMLTAADR